MLFSRASVSQIEPDRVRCNAMGESGRGYCGSGRLPTVVHVVDDEPSVRKAISRLLRAVGYDVEVYASARQLLDHLPEKSEGGCILLDLLMPDVNGLAVQKRLKEVGSTLPIVFMTGTEQSIEGDADAFLKKPVCKDELLDAIERAVGSFRAAE
jgi:FixJ family two-component response regulator